jgi:hypothetical protein
MAQIVPRVFAGKNIHAVGEQHQFAARTTDFPALLDQLQQKRLSSPTSLSDVSKIGAGATALR